MLIVFFDKKGVVQAEFLAPGETVDTDQYCGFLLRLKESIRRKRPHLWGKVRRGGVSVPHPPRHVQPHINTNPGFFG